jgi:Ca2+-binding EF-hand superfamily protein
MLRDFDALDANGDGLITTDELAEGMKQRRERRFRERRGVGGEDTGAE